MNKGQYYETMAARHLEAAGLHILQRNFRCKVGEIDLICREADNLVFVEVRYRRHRGYASPLQSVTTAKQRKLIRTAMAYLQRRGWSGKYACRFDVIAIAPEKSTGEDEIHWLRHAFTM